MHCAICLDDIEDKDKATTECGHVFHTRCLLENLATGEQGFKCPMCRYEMCSDKDKDVKEYSQILEDSVDFLEGDLSLHRDWVLYFYDECDELKGQSKKQKEEIKYLKKSLSKCYKNLKNSQSNLSKTVFDLDMLQTEKKRYIKCSRCNFLGHNSQSCQIKPKKNKFINPIKISNKLRNKGELFADLREGELSKLVENHFE